jgi:hypothetical protein
MYRTAANVHGLSTNIDFSVTRSVRGDKEIVGSQFKLEFPDRVPQEKILTTHSAGFSDQHGLALVPLRTTDLVVPGFLGEFF